MIAPINSNLSALKAFSTQIETSANNVANVYSDNYKKLSAVNTEDANGTVKTTITRIDTPGPLVEDPASPAGELKELSNTDLVEEMVNLMVAEYGFKANAKAIQSYEETLGTLLDMIG